jgi:spermidine synthase
VWFYAISELLIGIGGVLVPFIFVRGQSLLLPLGEVDSVRYLAFSAVVLGISILPWCLFMGCTFPFMIAFIRQIDRSNRTGFSFLYLANVIGAMLGTVLTASVLIELLGLRATLWAAALCNVFIALIAFMLSRSYPYVPDDRGAEPATSALPAESKIGGSGTAALILFLTGFTSMSMEVVWTRAFTPALRTTIYSFAGLLAVYLLATWLGSLLYRSHLAHRRAVSIGALLGFLAMAVFLPILCEDPRIRLPAFLFKILPWLEHPAIHLRELFKILVVLFSIFPFCAGLGYLTPQLIDDYSGGSPSRTGTAYAVNVLGCILGPLFAGYVLLPYIGVAHSLRLLAIPFVLGLFFLFRTFRSRPVYTVTTFVGVLALLFVSTRFATSYEDLSYYRQGQLRRDYTATVLAQGEGRSKRLYVNGIDMTALTPITKVMAHLPLVTLGRRPESALVICLGMGTTLRSVNSWDIDATAVELVPSVRKVYGYFFPEAERMLQQQNCRVIIDDGRRFLRRTSKKYDLITIDPPPPIEAAGSSLLYTREFYQLIKAHLKEDGILQQWFPGGEKPTGQAVARSLVDEFPYVRIYHSMENWGYHFLASTRPFPKPTVQQFNERLPEKARADLMEWSEGQSFDDYVENILIREIDPAEILNNDRNVVITDDRPYNEYFLLRRTWNRLTGQRALLK